MALLGFYDPSPGARKHLKIEYLFHGALHVADVGDFSQLVLPLRGALYYHQSGALILIWIGNSALGRVRRHVVRLKSSVDPRKSIITTF